MRQPNRATTAQMYKAARLYYLEGKSKTYIASVLKMEARYVTRALREAVTQHVVNISINEAPQIELEQRVCQKYGLERVIIAPGKKVQTVDACDDLFRRLGILAAKYFEELWEAHPIEKPFHVAMAGGARLLEFANAVPLRRRDNVYVHVTALVGRGALTDVTSHIEPTVAASILWTHTGSLSGHIDYETVRPYYFEKRPGADARKAVSEQISRLELIPSIETVVRNMDKADVVFAGFGFVEATDADLDFQNRIGMGSLLDSVITPKQMAAEGIVGDFCYCPYRANGSGDPKWRFFITAGHYGDYGGVNFYKHMVERKKKVVGIGGPHLLPAIRAALKGRLLSVLIIDEYTAQQLVDGK